MIEVNVPEFDYIVSINELDKLKEIPYSTSGVYVFFDQEGNPLYTGQASCLRSRIFAHFNGASPNNTQRNAWAFYTCKAIIENDRASKNVYECYFINFLQTPFNMQSAKHAYRGKRIPNEEGEIVIHPGYCQYILDNKQQCGLRPHFNRYCHLHGGNGVSRQSFIDQAIELYEKMLEAHYNK